MMPRLWWRGCLDAAAQAIGRNPAPRGQSGGALSPLLETLRTGQAARWIEGRDVLDCGCGRARLLDFLPPDTTYTGVDHDAVLISYLQRRYGGSGRHFIHSDLESFVSAHTLMYDSIVLTAVIEHLSDPTGAISALARLLVPGGVLILTTPAPRYDAVLKLGGTIGLFDREAEEDHEQLLGGAELERIVRASGLAPDRYYRFLFGGNQVLVARRRAPAEERSRPAEDGTTPT